MTEAVAIRGGWDKPEGKLEKVAEVFGDVRPDYWWYDLGKNINELTAQERQQIYEQFFEGRTPSFGNVELHSIGAHDRMLPEGVALRVRYTDVRLPEITPRGRACPLVWVEGTGLTAKWFSFWMTWR